MGSRIESKAFQELSDAARTIANPFIEKWKEDGGKVLGYISCSSMSEEIMTAAGLLPFRMRATGSTDTELSDAHLSSINCSFTRHCLNAALSGELDFLDGLIVPNSCDNVRRIYDHWIRQMKTPFVRMISLPRKAGEAQVNWFRDEFMNLKAGMEEHFGVEITDARLGEAIRLHNETRRLQRRLYDLRKGEAPLINGAETLTVTVVGTAMPKGRYNELLAELIDDLGKCDGHTDYPGKVDGDGR